MDAETYGDEADFLPVQYATLANCDLQVGVSLDDVLVLSDHLPSMTPWKELSFNSGMLHNYLSKKDCSLTRATIIVGSELAGIVCIRNPWLRGPYIELMCVIPGFQGLGVGTSVLQYIKSVARSRFANIWVCGSEFNAAALAFYEQQGFTKVCVIEGLVSSGKSEVLLRCDLALS